MLCITSDRSELDIGTIHRLLSEQSTWARGFPRALIERAIEHSICLGGFLGDRRVAFARVITDRATFANLVDVFVLPEFRGQGFGKALMRAVMAHGGASDSNRP